jgi:hypothetical protein
VYLLLAVLIGAAMALIAARDHYDTDSVGEPSPRAQPPPQRPAPLAPRRRVVVSPDQAGASALATLVAEINRAESLADRPESLDDRLKATVPDDLTLVSTFQDRPPVRPGVLTPLELYVGDRAAMAEIQAALGPGSPVDALHDRCNAAFLARGGGADGSTTWSVIIDVESLSGVARVRSAEVLPGHWPASFDAAMKDCYLQAFIGVEYPSNHDYHHVAEYPLCVYGGDALKDATDDSPSATQE